MKPVRELAQQTAQVTRPRVGTWLAVFSRDVTDLTELAQVVIPDFSDTLKFSRVRWMPRGDAALPNKGDSCVVVFDNRGNPWITAWWPF